MTISQIRFLQNISRICLTLTVIIIPAVFMVSEPVARTLELVWLGATGIQLPLLLLIRYLRCPVCHFEFVGRTYPMLYTPTCMHCGRRAGDTG